MSKGGRRGGELKIDWTKPPDGAWPMGNDCRLDLGRGFESVRGGQRGGSPGGLAGAPIGYHGVSGQELWVKIC